MIGAGDVPDPFGDVLVFMQTMGQHTPYKPSWPTQQIVDMRLDLIEEEYAELLDGVATGSMTEVADAIIDLLYVTIGMGHAMGLPMDGLWEEVQKANMKKAEGPVRPDGKRLKPEGWTAPEIHAVLVENGWEG